MISVIELINGIFYIALIILVIVLIVLGIRAIQTLNKVDKIVDDISYKSSKLDGVFNIIDTTTDVVSNFSDTVVNGIAGGIEKIFTRKKENKNE